MPEVPWSPQQPPLPEASTTRPVMTMMMVKKAHNSRTSLDGLRLRKWSGTWDYPATDYDPYVQKPLIGNLP